ncbi:glycosyltransferase involved in cell wall biosynthesis [Polynucleobacter sphagniphilus]|uniref:glycosyltransferase family 2 protein n=1 Tax=Polynucleobacter sphagniphilus TaxID=1743169 RepID=UPI002476CAFB|nr:glycosyltransferase [Polynucleobacter sphagniphilus]MDH6153982.1 glycosyltransferase involved in cell wall biosynthesis [Polynucleobacter sphagniphilus]
MSNPLVSVLMPAYNSESYLADSIDSILNQTYANIELIIFDDGSSDGTRGVINAYSDPRIVKILSDQNIGVVRARNQMIDRAQGKYIALMDADDIADPSRLQKQVLTLEAGACDLCGSAQWILDEVTGAIKKSKDNFSDADLRSLLTVYCTLCNSSVMGRAEIFKTFKYDLSMPMSEDYFLWTRMASAGYVFKNIQERLITYRVHPAQITATHLESSKESTKVVQQLYLKSLGISSELVPRQMGLQQRFRNGLSLLWKLNLQFPGMSCNANYEIYARFQFKQRGIWALPAKFERAFIALMASLISLLAKIF